MSKHEVKVRGSATVALALIGGSVLPVAGCSSDAGNDETATLVAGETETARSPELAVAGEREVSGLEGGVTGDIVEVDGCLGFMSVADGHDGVLSLPPGTVAIEGGARLPDGSELRLGDTDKSVYGMWVGSEDPSYPTDDYDCLGDSVVLVFLTPDMVEQD